MPKTYYMDIAPLGVNAPEALTYHHEDSLEPGRIVSLPYGKRWTWGVVLTQVERPTFPTKAIKETLELPPLPKHTLFLAEWMSEYYGASLPQTLGLFVPSRPDIKSRAKPSSSRPASARSADLSLSPDQSQAIKTIEHTPDRPLWLLHGVTGSGKTAVYIELAKRTLKQGRSVIMLVPEIVLATQIIDEFQRELPDDILITHSQMTPAQRRAVWREALSRLKPAVVIGPRSALFAPLADPGLIIMDECHETSYKQEQSPHYHAREVAAKMADLTGGRLVLGSATPSTSDMFLARRGKLELLELSQPIHINERSVEIVDMREHRNTILSTQLRQSLQETLAAGQQSILFLNRRGSSSQVLCSQCGLVQLCPTCDIPQTWHGDSGTLRCHWCNHRRTLPARCKECSSSHWRFLGIGTKRIETEVRHLYPDARILRLDRDSFSKETISSHIEQIRAGEIDILIGTQMIAKGLDLPSVSLIGVVLADTMLYIPDIYSNERTYQLLHQVIGRSARRSDQSARIVIQTYAKDHPAIKLASRQDYHRFIDQELAERQALGYPPYAYVLKLTCKRKTQSGAQNAATRLAEKISTTHPEVTVRGPAPTWRERMGGFWYWHLIITSKERRQLIAIMHDLPNNWRADIDPIDLL